MHVPMWGLGCGDLHSTFFPFDLIHIFIFSSLFNKTLLFSISHFSHSFLLLLLLLLLLFLRPLSLLDRSHAHATLVYVSYLARDLLEISPVSVECDR